MNNTGARRISDENHLAGNWCGWRRNRSWAHRENTGRMDVGEGVLWRSKVEPTPFMIYVADPVTGQVAIQARLLIQGRSALVAVRLKVDRGGTIHEVEAAPFVTIPYGLGDGWTEGSGR